MRCATAMIALLMSVSPPSVSMAAGQDLTIAVSIRDGRFNPARIEIPSGVKFRIELANEGPGPLEFENSDMHIEKVLSAGARSVVVLPGLPPGEHSFVDEFNPVTGELIIVAK